MDKENFQEIKIFENWISKQPHLPQNLETNILKRFLRCCNNSIENAKELIDLFFTLRNHAPEIFMNRDPLDLELKETFELIDFVPLPKLTKENYKILIYRLNDSNHDKFNYINSLKCFFMIADLRMFIEGDESRGEIPIFDMANVTLRHLTKVNLPVLKKYMQYTQEAHPIRLKQIHVLNTPQFLDRCLSIVKPFMKKEVADLLHFHLPNSTTIYDYIPHNLLPEDYGGTLKNVKELKRDWNKKLYTNRNFFLDDSIWKTDESKRMNNKYFQLYGVEGSFKSLNID